MGGPMGRLPSTYEKPADCTGQEARVQAGRVRQNLAVVDGEV